MKRILIIGMLLVSGWAQASVVLSQSFGGGTIVEGNPIGSVFMGDFTQANPANLILNLTVSLNVSGGYACGFYAYLVAPNGSTVVTLLNNPGVSDDPVGIGNTTPGLNLTLADGGTAITYTANLMNSGTYAAYGSLAGFNGLLANGDWTLYFADTASGSGNATLNGWSLDITVVPEPVNVALAMFGVLAAGFLVVRRLKSSRVVSGN